MTYKELDKLFREKFAAVDREFQESSWDKAKALIEKEDPAVVDDLVRRKFAAQRFAFNEGSWIAAKGMVDSMYRRMWIRDIAMRVGVFAAVLAISFGADSLVSSNVFGIDMPKGRPAVNFVANEVELDREGLATSETNEAETESGIENEADLKRTDEEFRSVRGPGGGTGTPIATNDEKSTSSGSPSESIAMAEADGADEDTHRAVEVQNGHTVVGTPAFDEGVSNETEIAEQAEVTELEPEELEEERGESRPPSARPSAPGMFNPIKGKSSYFGFTMGARVYEDFASAETGQVQISPTVGFRYAYMFHPKLSLNVGALYSYRRSTQTGHEFAGASYSFGAHNHSMKMVSSVMYQADIPLYLRYQVARGHFVYTGGYASITMASKNETASLTTAPYAGDVSNDDVAWGHMPGMRYWGYGVILGYDLRINENWQIGLRGQWGLVDWSEDDVIVDSPYDRNKEIKLLIEYRLND